MSNKPASQVVLITGCSSGFGLLTAAHLSQKGHKVIATMRNLDRKAPLEDELLQQKTSADILQLDVTAPDSIQQAISEIAHRHGTVDVLVNNAGYGIGGCFEDLEESEIRRQFETNFFGVQNVTRAVIPLMRQRQRGKIINISSIAGLAGFPGFGAYNASKWALEGFSESLRYELKPFGIDVHLIEPGTYKTSIFFRNARYAKNFDNPESPYFDLSQHLEKKTKEGLEDCHKDPQEIALLIEKIINAKRFPFRSHPDLESKVHSLLKRHLPFSTYTYFIEKALLSPFMQNSSTAVQSKRNHGQNAQNQYSNS